MHLNIFNVKIAQNFWTARLILLPIMEGLKVMQKSFVL
jgi:hypothetical protein